MEENINNRVGRCYELSAHYVCAHTDAVLIHGRLLNPWKRGLKELDHAWIEIGKDIFDPVMNLTLPKETYIGVYEAKEFKRYTHMETLVMTMKAKNWGPWEC